MSSPVNCPACGGPITPRPDTAGYKCDYCHAVFYPGEEDDGVQVSAEPADPSFNQACPLCSQTLVHASIAKMPVLYCTECHGLLMRMGTLPDLIDALRTRMKIALRALSAAPPYMSQTALRTVVGCGGRPSAWLPLAGYGW